MNQQPDKIFREKLGHYHKTPPATAWERIEAGLEKKTVTKFEWRKVAASLLLLTAIGYAVWSFRSTVEVQPVAQKAIDAHPSKADDRVAETNQSRTFKEETASAEEETSKAKSTPITVNKHVKRTPPTVTPSDAPNIQIDLVDIQEATSTSTSAPISTVDPDAVPVKKVATSITMTISVEEANQYLDKNALAEATFEEKKTSTFKKLLKKASDLKSNQAPFGDLREKKNEILALNFRHEKRGQNK
jgi:hypothetical protein